MCACTQIQINGAGALPVVEVGSAGPQAGPAVDAGARAVHAQTAACNIVVSGHVDGYRKSVSG